MVTIQVCKVHVSSLECSPIHPVVIVDVQTCGLGFRARGKYTLCLIAVKQIGRPAYLRTHSGPEYLRVHIPLSIG